MSKKNISFRLYKGDSLEGSYTDIKRAKERAQERTEQDNWKGVLTIGDSKGRTWFIAKAEGRNKTLKWKHPS